jgi:DNA polymerase-3 subunit delta'
MIVYDYFKKLIENDKLSHLFLLHGNNINNIKNQAERVASLLLSVDINNLSSNLNYLYLEKENDLIKKEQIERLQAEFNKKSLISGYRVYVIKEIDAINVEGSNSLLKFLEEPKENMVGLLLTTNKDAILPTIISRCQLVSVDDELDINIVNSLIERDLNIIDCYLLALLGSSEIECYNLIDNPDYLAAKDLFNAFLNEYVSRTKNFLYQKILNKIYASKGLLTYFLKFLIQLFRDILFYDKKMDIYFKCYQEEIINSQYELSKINEYLDYCIETLSKVNLPLNYDLTLTSCLIRISGGLK